MESRWGARLRALVGGAVALALTAPAAIADDKVESELQAMRDMVLQLKDQVENQQQQIEQQQSKIQAAGIEDERSSSSSLSAFLEGTDFSGSVAAGYFWNTSSPDPNAGANTTIAAPFHPDHNTINVDELWLSASREATSESPVGFGFDLVYGLLADAVTGSSTNNNSLWVSQAYLDWLTPFGVTLTAGKFGTHIGYEVAGAAYNYTITRGFTYNAFQPVSQIGAKMSGEAGPVGWMIGVVNSLSPSAPDTDDFKDLIWSLSAGNDMVSFNFAGEWGNDATGGAGFYGQTTGGAAGSRDNQEALTLDWIVEATPTDAATMWVNVTWVRLLRDEEPWGLGVNVGTHVAVTDKLGLTGRFEYGRSVNETRAAGATNGGVFQAVANTNNDVIGVTGTIDYMLAEGLTLKTEVLWNKVLDSDLSGGASTSDLQKIFPGGHDDEILLGAQLVYAF